VTMSMALVVLTFGPLGVRAAEDAKHQDHMGKMPTSMAQLMSMNPEECMKMMDKEHKGHVTKKDFMKFQEDLWKSMDKNKDGKVTTPEFTDAG
jgi:Ca2+-binding EF-hand superfamily protein